jgi:hypothetical protein
MGRIGGTSSLESDDDEEDTPADIASMFQETDQIWAGALDLEDVHTELELDTSMDLDISPSLRLFAGSNRMHSGLD